MWDDISGLDLSYSMQECQTSNCDIRQNSVVTNGVVTNSVVTNDELTKTGKEAIFVYFLRFQASAAKWIRTALFWGVTQIIVAISCRRFGTTYRSHLKGWRICILVL